MIKICSFLLASIFFFPKGDDKKLKELKESYRANLSCFSKQNMAGNLQIQCAYFPIQLIQNETSMSSSKSKKREYTFQLLLSSSTTTDFLKIKSDSMTMDQKIIYYSFDFKKDIQVKIDGKLIGNPLYYTFERSNFSGAPARCLVSLSIPSKTKKLEIIVNDKIVDKAKESFEFDMKAIEAFDKKVEQTLTH